MSDSQTLEVNARLSIAALGVLAAGMLCVAGWQQFEANRTISNIETGMISTLEASDHILEEVPKTSRTSSVHLVAFPTDGKPGYSFSGNLLRTKDLGNNVIVTFITAGHCIHEMQILDKFYLSISAPQLPHTSSIDAQNESIAISKLPSNYNGSAESATQDLGVISIIIEKWKLESLGISPIGQIANESQILTNQNAYSLSYPSIIQDEGHKYFVSSGRLQLTEGYQLLSTYAFHGSSGAGIFLEDGSYVGSISALPDFTEQVLHLSHQPKEIIFEKADETEQQLFQK
jgi:hypothetical protein